MTEEEQREFDERFPPVDKLVEAKVKERNAWRMSCSFVAVAP